MSPKFLGHPLRPGGSPGLYTRHAFAAIPAYNDNPYAQHCYEKRLTEQA